MRIATAVRVLAAAVAAAVALAPARPPAAAVGLVAESAGAVRYVAELAPGQPAGSTPARSPFAVLQMNLCNSGLARCYTGGRSVPEAAAVVRAQRPDVLTLNEICRGDGDQGLFQAMEETWPGDWVFWVFHPAWDTHRNAPYLCRNGEQYGIAVMGHVPAVRWKGVDVRGGIYPMQDAYTDEDRAWVCAYAIGSYYACTTHLDADNPAVAMAQCLYLMTTAIPRGRGAMGAAAPITVAGDLNLRYGGRPDVQGCVPPGWYRRGDGNVQHVVVPNDLAFVYSRKIWMRATDHPAWLVAVAPAGASSRD